jgi:hypothetical protein
MKACLFLCPVLFFCFSCKKNYACVCINPGGADTAFTTNATRSEAEKECAAYYNENIAPIPWNETYCSIN